MAIVREAYIRARDETFTTSRPAHRTTYSNAPRRYASLQQNGLVISGRPTSPVKVPRSVARLLEGREFDVVWRNELGGLTFHVNDGAASRYLKWQPHGTSIDLSSEVPRLGWAANFVTVPEVLDFGQDNEGSWLVTRPIDADNAVSERWKRAPRTAAVAIGEGLRALHDALPVSSCPFQWRATERVRAVRQRLSDDTDHEHAVEPVAATVATSTALRELSDVPTEDLVVCHGDACAPNTLIGPNGRWRAHVDLGRLGVGDRWADLAIAAWSTEWNYGQGFEATVYDAYGVAPDAHKIRYYRLLWDLEV